LHSKVAFSVDAPSGSAAERSKTMEPELTVPCVSGAVVSGGTIVQV
jgi:hypothetical protein